MTGMNQYLYVSTCILPYWKTAHKGCNPKPWQKTGDGMDHRGSETCE